MPKLAIAAASFGLAFHLSADTPREYYHVGGGDLLSEKSYRVLGDAENLVDWADGNILGIVNWATANCYPDEMKPYINGVSFTGNATMNGDIKAYGVIYNSGERDLLGSGKLEIGAGGYCQTLKCWDDHRLKMTGGLHLSASQKWEMRSGVEIFDTCPLTAAKGIEWTLSTYANAIAGSPSTTSRGVGLVVNGECKLDGVTMVLDEYARLHLPTQKSALGLDCLVIDGANAVICADPDSNTPPIIGPKYAKRLVLRNGASPAFHSFPEGSSKPEAVDEFEYDLDSITAESGTIVFGNAKYNNKNTGNYTYSIKDGGVLPLEVKSGASVRFISGPKAGVIRISGSGAVEELPQDIEGVEFDPGFTGSIAITTKKTHQERSRRIALKLETAL